MSGNDARGFNCSDRQAESTDDHPTCPDCDTPISGLIAEGPSDHFIDPWGCRVTAVTARDLAVSADRGRGVATDGGVEVTGPHECPFDEDYHHWRNDGDFYIRGHRIRVVCDCETEMEFDSFYGPHNTFAHWTCPNEDCGLDFGTGPTNGDPGNWNCFANRGHELVFTLADDGEFHYVLRREDARNLTFRVHAPTMAQEGETEQEVATDGGVTMMPYSHLQYWSAQVRAFLDQHDYDTVSITKRANANDLLLSIPVDSQLRERRNRDVFITELDTAGFNVPTTEPDIVYVDAPEGKRLRDDFDPDWQDDIDDEQSDDDLAAHEHANELEAALDHLLDAGLRAEDRAVANASVARLKLAVCGARLALYATSDEERSVGLTDATEHLETVVETVEDETVVEPVRRALQYFEAYRGDEQ